MSLATYKKKRNFTKTPEPKGAAPKSPKHALHYVIQKHDASHLHYDFRLELDGTLKSWAVPKGPSLDPARKALAVRVEDHPLDYETFEGVIPQGQYGGGTVMVWDRGTWEPLEDPREGLERGKLTFELHGEKLHGQWSLVQMHDSRGDGKNWLLMKSRDAYAGTQDILADAPTSAATHRTLAEIAQQKKAVWESHRERKTRPAVKRAATPVPVNGKAPHRAASLPAPFPPQLAMLVEHPPQGEQWIHEIKFDGYRLLAYIDHGKVTLYTRKGLDWTARFTALVEPLQQLGVKTAILDGEAVVLNAQGQSDFQLLQSYFKARERADLRYFIFDLLFLNGKDLREKPLMERKQTLRDLLKAKGGTPLEYSDHAQGDGEEIIRRACALGSEGIVSKQIGAPYVSRREGSWLKSKCGRRQEFVIVGYTASEKRTDGLRSLLLGVYDAENGLVYCGRVGTGFDAKQRRELLAEMKPLEQNEAPMDIPPPARERRLGKWVTPKLVCEVQFEGWTRDGILRHPSFIELRFDKPAREVKREAPAEASSTRKGSGTRAKKHTAPAKKSRVAALPEAATLPKADGDATRWAGVRMTHPDKLIYPADGIHKSDLANYYAIAAPFMLPHVVDRPLALMRCPVGMAGQCFFMRNWSNTLPPDIGKVAIGGGESHVAIHDAAGLFSMAQISALEIHTWNCRVEDISHPDQIIFDLDPGPQVAWETVAEGARQLKKLLESLKMKPFLKTSGGKGLHLTVPIIPNVGWAEAKAFTRTLATYLAGQNDLFIVNMSKAARPHKIYVDFLRNERTATAVAPYSSRARPGAAVSMPIAWDQLKDIEGSNHFTLNNAGTYLARRKKDPWAGFATTAVDLHQIARQVPENKE